MHTYLDGTTHTHIRKKSHYNIILRLVLHEDESHPPLPTIYPVPKFCFLPNMPEMIMNTSHKYITHNKVIYSSLHFIEQWLEYF